MTAQTDLIALINQLQDILSELGTSPLDLPQIAVVGSQSSGKSSVLEAIVGKDFLPKGAGIVTRRPLILQLSYAPVDPEAPDEPDEWAEFQHLPGQQFVDFDEVKREIERETARIAGDNKGISDEPITLRVHSPSVVDLTLVDLPGLTKIPVGDQPSDIELQIRDLIMKFILQPNCIILAVSPANVDLANSDSLKLAREVDPQGLRTLGLLTKVDLMETGSHALDILGGRVYPLRLGFVAVVNRSQRDIEARRTLEWSRKREQQFFGSHPTYAPIAGRCGTAALARTLNSVLLDHIRAQLPDLKARLSALIAAKQNELVTYGESPAVVAATASGTASPNAVVLRLIALYATEFQASIEGTRTAAALTDLTGGARIFAIFHDGFARALDALDPVSALTVHEIRTAIQNSTGARSALFFVPEAAFDLLVKPQIARLAAPAMHCVDHVFEELLRLTHECCSAELKRFPTLHARLVEAVTALLKEHLTPTRSFVQTLVALQSAYINTAHPDFIGGARAVAQLEKKYARERKRRDAANDHMRRLAHQYSAGPSSAAGAAASARGAAVTPVYDGTTAPPSAVGTAAPPGAAGSAAGSAAAINGRDRDGFFTFMFGQQPGARTSGSAPAGGPGSINGRGVPAAPASEAGGDGGDDDDTMSVASAARPRRAASTERGAHASDRDPEEFTIALIRSLITSYFGIVKKTLADAVPKAVMHLLVNDTLGMLQTRLVEALYRDEMLPELLQENPALVKQREACRAQLAVYQRAMEVIAQAY
ncbi:Dynamin- GTPase protein [Allomyces arbusculus]|nr:Dynamin- GTPase protein [Allomyces arbusculus]